MDKTKVGGGQRLEEREAEGQGKGDTKGEGDTTIPTPDAMRTARRKGPRNEMVGHEELKFRATFLDLYYIY